MLWKVKKRPVAVEVVASMALWLLAAWAALFVVEMFKSLL